MESHLPTVLYCTGLTAPWVCIHVLSLCPAYDTYFVHAMPNLQLWLRDYCMQLGDEVWLLCSAWGPEHDTRRQRGSIAVSLAICMRPTRCNMDGH